MGTLVNSITREWQFRDNDAVQTKTGGPFENFLALSTKRLAPGRYRVQWNFELSVLTGGLGSTVVAQIERGGSGIIGTYNHPGDNDDWCGYSGWDFFRFNEGQQPVFRIQMRRRGGTDTVRIRRAKISLERMGD